MPCFFGQCPDRKFLEVAYSRECLRMTNMLMEYRMYHRDSPFQAFLENVFWILCLTFPSSHHSFYCSFAKQWSRIFSSCLEDHPNLPSLYRAPASDSLHKSFSSPTLSTTANKLSEALLDNRLALVDRQIQKKLMTNSVVYSPISHQRYWVNHLT